MVSASDMGGEFPIYKQACALFGSGLDGFTQTLQGMSGLAGGL